ncbi:hypothetical protein [Endozoicomonas ascidiicola]|uniref:hypothetical protein n=1 Tax=Endozoicomonas ascidiicola TaxID=1698521 RepID=UPI000832B9BA|nr:hypothetical protein [Endozoicomonas ascidiicola]
MIKPVIIREKNQGVVLISALLFLLLLTTVVAVSVNQTTMSPRMLVNAEIRILTFNDAQGELATIQAAADDALIGPNSCVVGEATAKQTDPYYLDLSVTPPVRQCTKSSTVEQPVVKLRALGVAAQRQEGASGANTLKSDYFHIRTTKTREDISTTLLQDMYKAYWVGGDTGQSSGTDVIVDAGSN